MLRSHAIADLFINLGTCLDLTRLIIELATVCMSHAIPYKTTIPACRIANDSARETFSRMHLGYESVTIAP
jgi:hypothetical protein